MTRMTRPSSTCLECRGGGGWYGGVTDPIKGGSASDSEFVWVTILGELDRNSDSTINKQASKQAMSKYSSSTYAVH